MARDGHRARLPQRTWPAPVRPSAPRRQCARCGGPLGASASQAWQRNTCRCFAGLHVEGREHRRLQSGSIHAGGIDRRKALPGLQHTPLRGPDRAAERKLDGYATILVQHFFRAFEGEFGSANALSCSGKFQRQNIGRHPATVGVQSVHHELLTHGGAVRSLLTLMLRRLAACSQAGSSGIGSVPSGAGTGRRIKRKSGTTSNAGSA